MSVAMSANHRRAIGVMSVLIGLVLLAPLALSLYLVTMADVVGISPSWVMPAIIAMAIGGAALLAFGVRISAGRRQPAA
jgi:hypothetical protein